MSTSWPVRAERSDITLATPLLAQPTRRRRRVRPRSHVPPVVSAIGTAVFGLISFAESVFEGPPKALPGSGVTVERSTLDLGEQVVPADWYFPGHDPDSEAPPERIIYLQHGFLARGVFYDYTASYLAKETNSIVVAPTLTSNIFATDGMWLGGDPMHRAVADLFLDDNDALLKSATSSRLHAGPITAASRAGRAFARRRPGGGHRPIHGRRTGTRFDDYKLAGVLMLDGVSFSGEVPGV